MKELMDTLKNTKDIEYVGVVVYFDMSGYFFEITDSEGQEDIKNSIFDFNDITKLTVEDIAKNRTIDIETGLQINCE